MLDHMHAPSAQNGNSNNLAPSLYVGFFARSVALVVSIIQLNKIFVSAVSDYGWQSEPPTNEV